MQAEVRQLRIGQFLQRVEFASLEELAQEVEASHSTIRRDLAILEASGVLRRTHGGARILAPHTDEYVFNSRDTHQLSEKEAIGRACAALIQPGQTIIMDAGTTVYHVARHLEGRRMQIITNSLPIANLFASDPLVEVVVSGGVIYPRLGVMVGPLAVEAFSRMHVDMAIMSAGGITQEGITNSHGLLIEIQYAMIQAAQRVVFCLDHTKLGRKSLSHLCELKSIHGVVTDAGAPAELIQDLRNSGLEVTVANGRDSASA